MKATILFTLCLLLFAPCVANSQTAQTDDGSAEYTQSQKHYYQPETRLSLLKTAIEKGNSDALVDMGNIYYNGYANIKKGNYAEAQKYWSKAAEKGNPHGYFNIGILYLYGNGVEKDVNKTINYWTQSADLDNSHAMVALGNLYFDKKALTRDVKNAYLWFKKAVDNGNTKAIPAMLTAETMVEAEKTLKKPNATEFEKGKAYFELEKGKEAMIWLEKAAKKGDSKAMTALGIAIEKWGDFYNKSKKAAKWYEKAAKKGNEKAMYLLGKMYQEGKLKNGKGYIAAMKWYEKAAEKDDIDALLAMAGLYYSGKHDIKPNNIYKRSGPQKYKAQRLYEKVAKLGHPEGYFKIGYMLEYGYHFIKNSKRYGYADAGEYYQKAADMGYEEAETALEKYNKFFEYNMGVKHFERKEYAEAREMFEAADKKSGHIRAVKYLAQIHESGLGVEQNKKTAFNYYLRLARLGDVAAKSKVAQLYDNDPKYQSLVAQYRKDVDKASKEDIAKQLAKLEKQKQEEAAYQEMLYQQRLNRGRGYSAPTWQGFTYDAATRNSYNRTNAANKAAIETANYKRWLDYKFGK